MENGFNTPFLLRQHTPIIHFQPDQFGATLRGTELKPKFDRYLVKKAFGDEFDQVKFFLVGYNPMKEKDIKKRYDKGYRALDYSLTITPGEVWRYPIELERIQHGRLFLHRRTGKPVRDGFPCFFGNMGDDNQQRPKLFCSSFDDIKVDIFSTRKELSDLIAKHFSGFIHTHNFGTRQTKGFGSFSLVRMKEGKPSVKYQRGLYYFDVDVKVKTSNDNSLKNEDNIRFPNQPADIKALRLLDNLREVFTQIDLFHKVIKSGYNARGGYVKSSIFAFCKDVLNIQWDKRTIKQHFFLPELEDQKFDRPNSDVLHYENEENKSGRDRHFLIRDLLGLTSEASWRAYRANISKEHPYIERFPSPIVYKPIKLGKDTYRVNIFLRAIPKEMLNTTFSIKKNNDRRKLLLDTPESFSLIDYFDYLVGDRFNIHHMVDGQNDDTQRIVNIFNNLQKNKR